MFGELRFEFFESERLERRICTADLGELRFSGLFILRSIVALGKQLLGHISSSYYELSFALSSS